MRRSTAILVVIALAASVCAWAQTGTSRITGTVMDVTGAVLSGAKVTATHEGTNVAFSTYTSPQGFYTFESLQPGLYTISVEAPGFGKFITKQNELTIGQPMTVNARLQIGGEMQTVEVTAGAELVQTSTSGNFGNVVDQAAVTELPIVGVRGRNPLQLVNFQPGVVVGANTGGGVHVHGSRDRAWNYTLDGVDINETSSGGGGATPTRTNPDMVAEFRVVTGNATADIGRASGGQVAMITRSGTNELHGTGFFFYQTPGLNANEVANKIVTPPLSRNQFVQKIGGFSLGGPIRKEKTFFFGNFQFLRTLRTQKVTRPTYTAAARRGEFRYVTMPQSCIDNFDPDTCPRNVPAGSPGAVVDLAGNPIAPIGTYNIATSDPTHPGLDPQISKFFSLSPLPNDFTVGDGLNLAGFSWIAPENEKQEDYTVKVDHIFNQRHSMMVRWYSGHQNTMGDIVNDGQAIFPGMPNWVDTYRKPRNLAIKWRFTPGERMTNELVLGMNRFIYNFANGDPNYNSNPGYVFNNIDWYDTPFHNDAGNKRTLTTFQLSDNFSYVRGSHTMRFGTELRYQRHIDNRGSIGIYNANPLVYFDLATNPVDVNTFNLPANANPDYDWPTLQGAINDLLGRAGRMQVGLVSANGQWQPAGSWFNFDARFPEYDFYAQDNWKVRPNLVLDAGLRWEVKLSPRNPNNLLLRPDHPMIFGSSPSSTVSWVPGSLYDNSVANLGPSIGFAWDPLKNGKTSVRGNYRLAFDRINTFVISSSIIQSLPGLTYSLENRTFGSAGGYLRDGLPALVPPASETPAALRTPPPFSTNWTTVMDPNLTMPKTHMWGLSIQRDLGRQMVLELNYIGRHGTSLFGGYDANAHEIFSNGFLDAFKILQGGGSSPLIDGLLANSPDLAAGQTGSQYVRSQYRTTLRRNNVAGLAKAINQMLSADGRQLIAANGFSPYFFTPFPQFADEVDVLDTHDFSNYHAFEAQLQRRFSGGLQFQLSYTLAKSLDTRSYDPTFTTIPTGSSQSSSSIPWDNRDRGKNYARSDFDRRHAFQGNWVWELPIGKKGLFFKNLNPIVERIVGGWSAAGVLTLLSGRPFTVYSGAYTYNDTVGSPANCTGCSPSMWELHWENGAPFAPGASLQMFTPEQRAMFTQPPPGELSNLGRNYFNLPHYFNVDMAVGKHFDVTERQKLEMRLEMQNLTNSVMYGLPYSASITSSSLGNMFGRTANGARRMQISAKYSF